MIGDQDGNIIPIKDGESATGNSDGKWVQVRDTNGDPTGLRKCGPHNPIKHKDPRAQKPHGHVPGITNEDGTPWLLINY